mgnify:CR=1 FL=1
MKISLKTKSELLKALLKESNLFSVTEENDSMMSLLNDIWNLRSMPSEDTRYGDAYGDIVQHTINNNDWDVNYLLIERLKLLQDDNIFNKFIETIVLSKYRENEDDIMKFVLLVNSYIESENITLSISEYDENEQPVYSLEKLEDKNSFIDIPQNQITFFVVKNPRGHSDRFSSHSEPDTKPAFVLAHNDGWNDYSSWTTFSLFYYKNDLEKIYIGDTKITNGIDDYTTSVIQETFKFLPDSFCSLGQDYSFYQNLKEATGKNFESVLFALKDAAFFTDIHDKFEKNPIFKHSLIRSDNAERLLRQAKHKIYNYDLSNLYSFKYQFDAKYSKDSVEVTFDFNRELEIPNRIFAIIGKNGTGKTQLITKLPLDISKKNNNFFVPRPPLFSKVIAVSYSIFDNFEIPKKTSIFNYVYCGLHTINDGKKEILTQKQQVLRFHNTWKKIKSLERMKIWRSILLNFIDKDIVDELIIIEDDSVNILTVSVGEFNKIKHKLSSGQNIMLFIISEILANIRFDSLILFDEPETHLHPNAISQLMNLIYDLVYRFDSYCLITTHSPLIVRELLSRNVYIMERHENTPSIRKIGIESFGENLTTLTEDVFGNREIQKQYKTIIDRLILKGFTYSQINEKLESDNTPLSLNARLYIKSQVSQ